jgi:hypothetical protein
MPLTPEQIAEHARMHNRASYVKYRPRRLEYQKAYKARNAETVKEYRRNSRLLKQGKGYDWKTRNKQAPPLTQEFKEASFDISFN